MGFLRWAMKMMGRLQITLAGLVIFLNSFLIYNASTNDQSSLILYLLLYFYNAITPLLIALYGWQCTSVAAIPEDTHFRIARLRSMIWLPIIGTICPLAVNGTSMFRLSAMSEFRVIGDFRCLPALFSNTRDPNCDNEHTMYIMFSDEWTMLNVLKWLAYSVYNASMSWMFIFSAVAIFAVPMEQETEQDRPWEKLFDNNTTGRMQQWILGAFVFMAITGLFHLFPCVMKAVFNVPVALIFTAVLVSIIRQPRPLDINANKHKSKTSYS